MKRPYNRPGLEWIEFDFADVLTASGVGEGEGASDKDMAGGDDGFTPQV